MRGRPIRCARADSYRIAGISSGNLGQRQRSFIDTRVSWLALSVLVVVAVQSLPPIAMAAEGLESISDGDKAAILERVREELKAHAASCENVNVRWTRQESIRSAKGPKILPFARMNWVRSGIRETFRTEGLESLDGPRKSHSWYSYDGERSYTLWYHHSDPSQLNTGTIVDGEDQMFGVIDISRLLGWRFSGQPQESLTTMLARPGAKLHGKRQIRGEVCYEIEVGPVPRREDKKESRIVMVWIDPQNGWLPRRIQVGPAAEFVSRGTGEADDVPQRYFRDCEVKSFQQVPDALNRERVYFPKDAEIINSSAKLVITVDTVGLIRVLPDTAFRPEIPDGVKLQEFRVKPRLRRSTPDGE